MNSKSTVLSLKELKSKEREALNIGQLLRIDAVRDGLQTIKGEPPLDWEVRE